MDKLEKYRSYQPSHGDIEVQIFCDEKGKIEIKFHN